MEENDNASNVKQENKNPSEISTGRVSHTLEKRTDSSGSNFNKTQESPSSTGKFFKVVLIRSGETEDKTHFCGWSDSRLSEEGRRAIVEAGKLLKRDNYTFDLAYCSALKRSKQTLSIILNEFGLEDMSVVSSWRLNGRHIGALTGMNKSEIVAKYGEEQVNYWFEATNFVLPAMDRTHKLYSSIYNTDANAESSEYPMVESLAMAQHRVVKYWKEEICPNISAGKKIIIISHNKTLQRLIQYLDDLDYCAFINVSLPNAVPFYYRFDETLKPVFSKFNFSE